MKKISFFILLVHFFNIFLYGVSFGISGDFFQNEEKNNKKINELDKEKKNNIVKNWKNRKQNIIRGIYKNTNIASLINLNSASNELYDISKDLEMVSENYKAIKKQKKSNDKKYKEVLGEAKNVINLLNKIKKDLNNKMFSIKVLSKDIKNLEKQVKNINDTIYISKKQVERHIGMLYKINNDYYSSVDGLDEIKLLLKSNNIAQTLSKEDVLKMLSLKTQELLGKLEKHKKIKKGFLNNIYKKKFKYKKIVNEYKIQMDSMKEKKEFLVDLFNLLKNNKKDIDKIYNRLLEKRKVLKKKEIMLKDSLSSKKQQRNITGTQLTGDELVEPINIDLSSILKYTTKTDGNKFLSWPVKDSFDISAYFKDTNYYNKFGWEHDGVDIKVDQGSEIYSTAAGYVYHVVDSNSDYYNYIIIVHNHGYVSIYGHILKSYVKRGDIVKRGQLIGASGGKKGTRGAGKMSTGEHLHFEVYKNSQLIDPFSALDLSVYKYKKLLPNKWSVKYLKDSITRRIDLSSLNFLSQDLSHKERQKKFLKRAGSGFNNLELWKQKGKINGIDEDFAICLGYAESGLGINTTTKNNIGNVGNNDRGDRKGYEIPEKGINAIYYALNNKYLSKHHTIDQLSRYGNKSSHIFSSSSYNWHKNVIKCLSMIHGHPVDEYYPFREISKNQKTKLAEYDK